MLAAKDRVGGPRRRSIQFGRGNSANPARNACLLEDRLGEVGPGRFAFRAEVVDPVRQLEELIRRLSEMTHVGRRSALVVHDRYLVLLLGESKHRADEVLPGPAEKPRAPDDPALPHLALALELRAPVHREGIRLVGLDIRLALSSVEDVVRGVVDDRRAERDDVRRSVDVDELCSIRVALGTVDVGPSRSMQYELRPVAERGRDCDVEPLARARITVRKDFGECRPQLPAGPGDQEAA